MGLDSIGLLFVWRKLMPMLGLRFDLNQYLSLSSDMPISVNMLSDTSRLLILDLLSRLERWHWRYDWQLLTDEQWDVAQDIVDKATKEVIVTMLTGMIVFYPTSITPDGFLVCDGGEVSREEYADLFGVIGETFGPGNGTTTFNLPELEERFVRGSSPSNPIGSSGGEDTVTLQVSEMPIHTHSEGIALTTVINGGLEAPAASAIPSTGITGSAGSGQAHNNVPAYLSLTALIKT